MSKKQILEELTNLLAKSLRHKIGSNLNKDAIYADRYAKDADVFFKQAEKVNIEGNWNIEDKIKIKDTLKRKLKNQLQERDFIPNEKYSHIDKEVDEAMKRLGIM